MCGLWLSYFFEKSLKDQNLVSLSEQQKEKLLKIAREGIEICLKTGKIKNMKEKDPKLLRTLCGAFVTLRLNKELRGCVGNIITSKPLYQTVQEMAVESATGDPRFRVLSLKELSQVDIEISVLSVLCKIGDVSEIKMGTHGIIVQRGTRSGVFLPQVANETGWSREEFLSNLCQHKACIAKDAWKLKDTEICTFTEEVFAEKKQENT